MDAAAQLGVPTNKTGGETPSTAGAATPTDAVKGAIQQLNKFNGSLGDIREGLSGLSQQFPASGKGGQQILQLIDLLQKGISSYMADIVKQTSRDTTGQQNLGSVLR
jgi:hypothetical protein